MSSSRPTVGGKITRKTEEKRNAELDQGVRFTIGDDVHEVRIGDITPRLAREVRRETGLSVMQLLEEVGEAPDIDTVASLVWVARRLKGEVVDLDSVLDYGTLLSDDFDIAIAGPEDDDSPEA